MALSRFFNLLDCAKGPTETAEEWPEPERLQSELPPVKPFLEDLLPVSLRPLVLDVSKQNASTDGLTPPW
jgi:hypothetical protein